MGPIKQLIRVCGFLGYLKVITKRSNYKVCAQIHVDTCEINRMIIIKIMVRLKIQLGVN